MHFIVGDKTIMWFYFLSFLLLPYIFSNKVQKYLPTFALIKNVPEHGWNKYKNPSIAKGISAVTIYENKM